MWAILVMAETYTDVISLYSWEMPLVSTSLIPLFPLRDQPGTSSNSTTNKAHLFLLGAYQSLLSVCQYSYCL